MDNIRTRPSSKEYHQGWDRIFGNESVKETINRVTDVMSQQIADIEDQDFIKKCDHAGYINTDREIWREKPGDYYSNYITVTESGAIGIICVGYAIIMPVEKWHSIAEKYITECEERAYKKTHGICDHNDLKCRGSITNCETCGTVVNTSDILDKIKNQTKDYPEELNKCL